MSQKIKVSGGQVTPRAARGRARVSGSAHFAGATGSSLQAGQVVIDQTSHLNEAARSQAVMLALSITLLAWAWAVSPLGHGAASSKVAYPASSTSSLQLQTLPAHQVAKQPSPTLTHITRSTAALEASLAHMETALGRRQALQGLALAVRHGQVEELDASTRARLRELYLRAGFAPGSLSALKEPPPQLADQEQAAHTNDTATFSRDIARRVVADQVDDFLENVNILTDIGRFVSGKLAADQE